jgi:Winged helix-turn helix
MRNPSPLPNGSISLLKERLKQAKTRSEYQRVLCVFLRATTDLNPEQIAEMLSWNTGTVRRIQSEFIRKGDSIFCISDRGGRHNQHLTIEEEDRFLAPFIKAAQVGGVIVATDIKQKYEELVGRKVPKSTIYRLLARHDWRQIVPRPKHPKSDPVVQETFKKTLPKWLLKK